MKEEVNSLLGKLLGLPCVDQSVYVSSDPDFWEALGMASTITFGEGLVGVSGTVMQVPNRKASGEVSIQFRKRNIVILLQ